MGDISFNQIPDNNRVPGVYGEIDNSQANKGPIDLGFAVLMIAQRLSTGLVAEAVPTLITSKGQGVSAFGRGSNMANMIDTFITNNPLVELWCIALDDESGGVAATGTMTVTGTATANGVLYCYVAGVRVPVSVSVGDTATDVGDAIEAAVNALPDLPCTASNSTGTVTFTARHKGEIGNDIDLQTNYRGELGGESTPAGISVAVVAMASGATNPDVDTAFAALSDDDVYNIFITPYTDSGSLDKIDTEKERRWAPLVEIDGHCVSARAGTVGALSTFGNSRNGQHVTVFDAFNESPSPAYLIAAACAARMAQSVRNDPARPYTSLPLTGILPPPKSGRRTNTERDTLLHDGVATLRVTRSGEVQIERGITTYQTNSASQPDPSYLDSQTLFTLSYLRRQWRARITQKFPRHKLADDGTRFSVGQAIVTPKVIKSEAIAFHGEMEEEGLAENIEQFKVNLVVVRNGTDPNRMDTILPFDIVNQFRQLACSFMFRV